MPYAYDDSSITDVYPKSLQLAVLRRIPQCSAIVLFPARKTDIFTYEFYGSNGVALPSKSWNWVGDAAITISPSTGNISRNFGLVYGVPSSSTTYTPHGECWYAGSNAYGPLRFIWIDVGVTVNITVTATTATNSCTVYCSAYEAVDRAVVNERRFATAAWTTPGAQSTSFSFAPDVAAYYAFGCGVVPGTGTTTISTGTVTVNVTSTVAAHTVLGHLSLPGLLRNQDALANAKITAASVLVSNTAADLYKQGKICMYQIPAGEYWQDYLTSDPFSTLTKLSGAVTLPANKGMYGYLKPAGSGDLVNKNYFLFYQGHVVDSFYPIFPDPALPSSSLIVATNITAETGRDLLLSLTYGIEYETDDLFREVQEPPADDNLYHAAIIELRDTVQFTENPIHVSKIWSSIKSGAGKLFDGIVKYGPKVVATAAELAPVLAAL